MNKKIILPAIIALNFLAFSGQAQNVGIGQNTPASKLDVKGNLTIGSTYSGTAAPANGAIIQGNVGIGNSSPASLLTVGSTSPVTIDNNGNVKIPSLTTGQIITTSAGGLVTTVGAPATSGTYLQWNGSAYTWAAASASLSPLSPGTGLSGSAYNGSSSQTWSVNYGSTSGTAVQGNTQITFNAGTGLSGSGTITLGSGGTINLTNTGVISTSVTSPIINSGTSTSPNISLGTVGVANGGTGNTSLTTNGLLYGNGTSAIGVTSAGTSGQVLIANSSGVPTFTTMSGDATISSTGVVTVTGSGSGNGYIKNQDASQQSATYYISGPASIGTAPASNTSLTVNAGSTSATGISATGGSFIFGTGIAGQVPYTLFGGIGVSGLSPGSLAGNSIGVAGYYGAAPFSFQDAGVYGTSNSSGVPGIYAYNSANGVALTVQGTTSLNGNTTETGNISVSGTSNLVGTTTLGTTNGTNVTGVLVYDNSANNNTVTLQSGATSTSYTLTLPTAQGANGTVLTDNGSGALSWTTPPAGTVTSVATGTGLTGGTITSSGTISLANTAVTAGSYGSSIAVPAYTVNAQGQLTASSNVAISASGIGAVTSVGSSSPISITGTATAPVVNLGTVPIAKGGTNLTATPTNGQLLIGNGGTYSLANLTAGTGINITNAAGAITIASTATVSGTAGGILYGTGSSYGTSAAGTAGQVLISGGAGAPTWGTAFSGTGFIAGSGLTLSSNTLNSYWTFDNSGTNNLYNNNTGNIGIGTSTPSALFSVGAGATSPFQINSAGAIAAATGITSSGTITFSGLSSGLVVSSASGVLSNAVAGTGISIASGTITNTGVTSITGTANQVTASASTGAVTLSLPQSIATSSSPTFAGLTLSGLAASSAVYTNGSSALTTTAPTSGTLGFWTLASGNLYPSNLADVVGIGTTTPAGDAGIAVANGHIESQQTTAPTTTIGSAAGSSHGASAALTNATDVGGTVTITCGSSGLSTGAYVTVNFNQSYITAPVVVVSATNSATAAENIYITTTTSSFTINFAAAGAARGVYSFNYIVLETH